MISRLPLKIYKYNVNWLTAKLPITKDINSNINKFNPLLPLISLHFFKYPPIITSISFLYRVIKKLNRINCIRFLVKSNESVTLLALFPFEINCLSTLPLICSELLPRKAQTYKRGEAFVIGGVVGGELN